MVSVLDLPTELHNKILENLSTDHKINYHKAFGVEVPPKLYYDRVIDDINKRIKETKKEVDQEFPEGIDVFGEIRMEYWIIVSFITKNLNYNYDYTHCVSSFFETLCL